MEKIKTFFRGEISKKSLTHRLLPLTIGGFSVFLIIARILFPYDPAYPYSWTTSMISRLGIPHQNPIGWLFFSAAFIWLGVFSLPLVPYMYKRFSRISEGGAKILAIIMIGPFISDILLGAIPNFLPSVFRAIHGLNAVIAFQGVLLMAFLSLLLMLYRNKQGIAVFSRKLVLIYGIILIYGFLCSILVLVFMEKSPEGYYSYIPGTPLFASAPVWEWQGFISLLSLIVILCFIVPEDIQ